MVSLFYLDIKMSEIRLNLFRIASGPAHLTFPMALTSKVEPRLSMDVHFSELVNVLVDVVSAEVDLDKHRPEEDFNFTFRTIVRGFLLRPGRKRTRKRQPPPIPKRPWPRTMRRKRGCREPKTTRTKLFGQEKKINLGLVWNEK